MNKAEGPEQSSSEESGRIWPLTQTWQSWTFPVLGEPAKLKLWEEVEEVVLLACAPGASTALSRTRWSHLPGMRRSVTGERSRVKTGLGTSQGFHEHLRPSISLSASKAWVQKPCSCTHVCLRIFVGHRTGAATTR